MMFAGLPYQPEQEKRVKPQAYKIALVPFPCTMLSCLGYLIYTLRGLIDEKTMVFYHWGPNRVDADKIKYSGTIALFGKAFEDNLSKFVKLDPNLTWLYNRACNAGTPQGREAFRRLRQVLRQYWQYPQLCLDYMTDYLRRCMKLNPVKFLPSLSVGEAIWGFGSPWPGKGEQFFTLPVRLNQFDHLSPITDWRTANLPQEMIGYLRNQSLVVAIGGPPNSGKSTLAATLARASNNLIHTIQSQEGWDGFEMEAIFFDMDAGTPTVEAIAHPGKVDAEALRKIKRPWTDKLALERVNLLKEARRANRIIFADLPGRITEITEILLTPADVSVVIANDWRRQPSWRRFCGRNGKEPIAIVRSRLRSSDYDSAITRYLEGESVSGRISLLTRLMKPENEFVRPFIVILLLDILPNLMRSRERVIKRATHDPSQGIYKSYEPD
ncbi:MAG: hypothetical protein HW405_208 [Candidatus Berkelbacteria bacterium]|nr:hypothetical protein [Candidatus Berkelbacteria bacterium]